MLKWEDASSWSQSDSKEKRAVPKTWRAHVGKVRLSISRNIHHSPDAWVVSCRPQIVNSHELKSKDVDDAKTEAEQLLREALEDVLQEME